MGGHACGEVASEIVVTNMRDYFGRALGDGEATWPGREERGRTDSENMLNAGIRWSNYSIWEKGHADAKFKNMVCRVTTKQASTTSTRPFAT